MSVNSDSSNSVGVKLNLYWHFVLSLLHNENTFLLFNIQCIIPTRYRALHGHVPILINHVTQFQVECGGLVQGEIKLNAVFSK